MAADEDDAAGAGAAPARRAPGLKALVAEEASNSLRLLLAVSSEQLAAPRGDADQDRIARAMGGVLAWLHAQIPCLRDGDRVSPTRSPPEAAGPSVLPQLVAMSMHWHAEHQKQAMSMRFWLLWTELGCSLEALRASSTAEIIAAITIKPLEILKTEQPPMDFPKPSLHCAKQAQATFVCSLWDAAVANPLQGCNDASITLVPRFFRLFQHWTTLAMRGYEIAFLANVGVEFSAHLRSSCSSPSNSTSMVTDAFSKLAASPNRPTTLNTHASSLALMVLSLSALTTTKRPSQVDEYLMTLHESAVQQLIKSPFPSPHSPSAIAIMAFGLAALEDAAAQQPANTSGNATLLQQFALLRIVNLPLLSFHLAPCSKAALMAYGDQVNRGLKALVLERSNTKRNALVDLSLRMTETCVQEAVGFFRSSQDTHVSLVMALQTALPQNLFRANMVDTYLSSTSQKRDEASLWDIVAYLQCMYGVTAPILATLATSDVVQAFRTLSKLEFARETCACTAVNASMSEVTQQLEQTLEQGVSPPEVIFSTIFSALATNSSAEFIPSEMDIVSSCQSLAVGLMVQRKLRVLLFQCPGLVDDALTVVFSGLFSAYEPLDTFAHRFLGVCIAHLTQFVPLYTVFPHYLKLTLAAYPAKASQQTLTTVCGTIFGALFYAQTTGVDQNEAGMPIAHRMALWAMQKCSERSSELLTAEQAAIKAAVATAADSEKSQDQKETELKVMKSTTKPSSDGLYLAGLVFELMKMAPMELLQASAKETERLLARWTGDTRVLRELKNALFERISQNCDAEKRAWLAAWYVELDQRYPTERQQAAAVGAQSRL